MLCSAVPPSVLFWRPLRYATPYEADGRSACRRGRIGERTSSGSEGMPAATSRSWPPVSATLLRGSLNLV